jgi:hypothetical protein
MCAEPVVVEFYCACQGEVLLVEATLSGSVRIVVLLVLQWGQNQSVGAVLHIGVRS